MRLFEVRPDENWFARGKLLASRGWSLPGVSCPTCGWKGGAVGLAYPCLRLPSGLDAKLYESGWPVTPERLRALAQPLRALVPTNLPTQAGMEFGPLVGEGSGRFADMVWIGSWTLLISRSALQRLESVATGRLRTVPAEIRLQSGKPFEHLEIQIEAHAQLAPSCLVDPRAEPCSTCGIRMVELLDEDFGGKPRVKGCSIPDDQMLVQIRDLEEHIIATEPFVEAVRSLEFSNIIFDEIDVE